MPNKKTNNERIESTPDKSKSGKFRKVIGPLALTASMVTSGMAVYEAHQSENSAKKATADAEASVKTSESFAHQVTSDVKTELATKQAQIDYLAGATGLTKDNLEKHMAYPTIPDVPGTLKPEVGEKQDEATLYLFKYDTHSNDSRRDTPLGFACTVVKTGANRLSSAAHCFAEVDGQYPNGNSGKGAYVEPDSFISSYSYFVSDKSSLTLGETSSAMLVTGFNKNYSDSDSAVLEVSGEGDALTWFDAIAPLKASDYPPEKGDVVRVSGYPNDSVKPVSGEGIVLGEMPPSLVGLGFLANMTIVGLNPNVVNESTCSFGGSGGTVVNAKSEWFGALAYIGRSDNPEGSPAVTPTQSQILQMEDMFQTKLAGENYILCGFAPELPLEPKQIITDPNYVVDGR